MYVDAIYNRKTDTIEVVERVKGERVFRTLDPEHVFYFEHPNGSHQTIFGETCKRVSHRSSQKSQSHLLSIINPEKGKPRRIFESDINPVFRSLETHYSGADTPTLHTAFFDIETEFAPEVGYAPTHDPFNRVTAISIYCNWLGEMITLALLPPTLTIEQGQEMGSKFSNCFVFEDEAELLATFIDVVDDADILSGWNSEGYDIPYMLNRMKRVLGADSIKKLCLFGEAPREREYEKFKKKHKTYDLVGRVHLDYLLLYQKHNPQQLHSYRLDFVGEIETGEKKVPYDGTLDKLWKDDFDKFIEYSRQDVFLLDKIDKKKKFIELANQIAHANCVVLKTTTGSVALVEQAIINEMHTMGFVVPDRKRTIFDREHGKGAYDKLRASGYRMPPAWEPQPTKELIQENIRNAVRAAAVKARQERFGSDDDEDEDDEDTGRTPVVGAYVADPRIGLVSEVACVDINSLYPSAIRALNMSPETIRGQCRSTETMALIAKRIAEGTKRAEAWDGLFHSLEYGHILAEDDALVTIDFEDGRSETRTGAEWYAIIFDPKNYLCITANGTIFSTEKDGMIPLLLARWYADRKTMQKKAKEFGTKASEAKTPEEKADALYWQGFWDQRQQARKILLNSLYGALLNEGLRFYDERLGQSVTLTGRSIVRHMNGKCNEAITGKYDYKGEGIVYADTDSCYFSAIEFMKDRPEFADFEWTRENVIQLYDGIADYANESFPEFMKTAFNTTLERGSIIAAGRELVAGRALFIKKKKYACLMYDKEGERLDVKGKPGKLKAMGLDLKRADTPKKMQVFLEKVLMDLLTDVPREQSFEDIKAFREDFKTLDSWEKGSPKGVKALNDFLDRDRKADRDAKDFRGRDLSRGKKEKGKIDMPGHVRASLNWNRMLDIVGDKYSMRISDGSKVVVCKLKGNVYKMDSIAYPIDEPHLPDWFKGLPFNDALMEETIIDNKLSNLVGVLDWDLSMTKDAPGDDLFTWG
jgi:DNA polymerase elongation subunit (family B)